MPKKERSRRPMPRPEADESTTRAGTPTRPRMRPEDFEERVEIQSLLGSDDAAYRASRREAEDMDMQEYAEGGRVRTTRRMPSGAQQYVRPTETGRDTPVADQMRTINNISGRSVAPGLSRAMTDAILDESGLARVGDSNERQTRDEDFNNAIRDIRAGRRGAKKFAEGGMVRGCKPAQMSGKGFKGTF